MVALPTLEHRLVTARGVRVRDARALDKALGSNRAWLEPWEATTPLIRPGTLDTKSSIRGLLKAWKEGTALPLVLFHDHEVVGQLNVSQITYGSLSSATLGYWVVEKVAGRGITPVAVAMATDYLFFEKGLHRMEVCIRPENTASLRVVEKLGFRYEGFRRRYIHIDGKWADHFCFALVVEEVPTGVLTRYEKGAVPPGVASIPELDWVKARNPLSLPPR
ncbi:MAG: GNAT family protein [Pontimonas sp.]|jgi:ribosomal-protein-alanine N-acetyltransferase